MFTSSEQRKFGIGFVLLTCCVLLGSGSSFIQPTAAQQTVVVEERPIAEGRDFATTFLHDPWDMQEYSDVSMFMNGSGQRRLIPNPRINDGLFEGSSFADATFGDTQTYFYPLYPGYTQANEQDLLAVALNDKIGYLNPIPNEFSCFHIALQSNSAARTPDMAPDSMRVYWFADRRNELGPQGLALEYLYPEQLDGEPTPRFQVISVDLANPENLIPGSERWNSRAEWQGLRVDPMALGAGRDFAIDWIRLTDCEPRLTTIQWRSNAAISAVWLRPLGTDRDIRLQTGINGSNGRATIDVQGVAAGQYQVGLGSDTSCCLQYSNDVITINNMPTARFDLPAGGGGDDYATLAGNPWDFRDPVDAVVQTLRSDAPQVTWAYRDNHLEIVTPSGPLPAGSDVAVFLNTPIPFDPSEYRYLTIDMETEWHVPWQNIPDGMIARWYWEIQGTSGIPGRLCTMGSPDIVYDVGRHTYTIDLFDPANGTAEGPGSGECPDGPLNWRTGEILGLRFDPNENITALTDPLSGGGPFTQRLYSIRLTKEEQVSIGEPYISQLTLDKAVEDVRYFYTTDRRNPTQNSLSLSAAASQTQNQLAQSPQRVFLPLILNNRNQGPGITLNIPWDTSNVASGRYYICAVLSDNLNTNTRCSDTPVLVR